MPLNINGTTGISGVDGSVSAPAVTGTDSNTGITFPSADTIKFSTGGVERMAITNSGVTGAFNPSSNVVLEQFLTYADGTAVSTKKGSVAIQNVTAKQQVSTTHTDVTGSSITYEPPDGCNLVIYKYICAMTAVDNYSILHFKFLIDGTDITGSRTTFRNGVAGDEDVVIYEWPIVIGGSTSTVTGRQATWSGTKTLKLQVREYNSSYEADLHQVSLWDGASSTFLRTPLLGITAIGTP